MPGALTTKSINFNGTSLTMRVWDESGIGTGPYSFAQTFTDGDGATIVTSTSGAMNTNITNANPNGLAVAGSSAPVVIAPQTLDVSVTPTVTASAYTAGFGLGGAMTFASILPTVGLNGILQSITAKFKATAVTGSLEVAIFKATPTGTYTDHVAPTWTAADMANLIGIYTLSTPNSKLGAMTVYNLDGIGKAFVGASTSLFAVVIVDGTPTPASTADFTLELAVLPG